MPCDRIETDTSCPGDVSPSPADAASDRYAVLRLVLTTVRAKRVQRRLVRGLTRYGPISVRLLYLVFGIGLVTDALVNHSALW
jgi:hypothetical protein